MMQQQQRQYQEAAERRFLLQLEEIRQKSKEDRYDMARFFTDLQMQGDKSSSSSCDSPEALNRKFRRLDEEAIGLIRNLQLRIANGRPYHEIEVFVKSVNDVMSSLRQFVSEKVDILDENSREDILGTFKQTNEMCLNEFLSAKSYIAELKAREAEDRHAGCLPSGIVPPTYHGNPLEFPTFWDAFAPLVHDNPKVSKFYKMSYLKSALKGDAAGALNCYPTTAENYDAAVAAVEKRFGREQVIIRSQVQELLYGRKIDHEPKQLRSLLDKVVAKKSILEKRKVSWDQVFTLIIEQQLPKTLQERWIRHVSPLIEGDEAPASSKLIDFLTAELAALETLRTKDELKRAEFQKVNPLKKRTSKPSLFSARALVAQSNHEECVICSQKHDLSDCPKFRKLSPNERLNELIKRPGQVCFKCLKNKNAPGHPLVFRKCTSKCSVTDCGKPHHVLLHVDARSKDEPVKTNALMTSVRCFANSSSKFSDNEIETLLPTALATIQVGRKEKPVRVGFDTFSQKSFITKEVASDLQLESTKTDFLNIEGFGGTSNIQRMNLVRFTLRPNKIGSQEKISVEAHVQDGPICSPLQQLDFDFNSCPHLKDLNLADPYPRRTAKIDVLLGGRYYFHIMQGPIVGPEDVETAPFAIDTLFGWVLAGPCHVQSLKATKSSKCMALSTTPWSKLEMMMEKFWSFEAIGLVDKDVVHTREEKDALKSFENSVEFKGRRYAVALPFKSDAPKLASNYPQARLRLMSCERSLSKDASKRASYTAAIEDYVKNGFARELTEQELKTLEDKPRYFVPHHPVFKESSSSTKVRIVFDASAKDGQGNSLNNCLLKGPNLLPDIVAVLLRFRMHKIALNGDLRKMFCQTLVVPDHQRYQLYLWRGCNARIKPRVYAMERLMFGVTSSPFLAIQTVLHHSLSEEVVSRYGYRIHDLLVQNMYMDDIHLGGDTPSEVINLQKDIIDFFHSGGWDVLKFASNSADVMEATSEERKLPNLVLDFSDKTFGEAASLGLRWDTIHDQFFCKADEKLLRSELVITKRSILSKVSQIFDLFGFLGAFTIRAKVIIQKLWKLKVAWDESLPEDVVREYRSWESELSDVELIKINRSPFSSISGDYNVQIHGFCDASESAYAAVCYLRIRTSTGATEVSYLMAKTRVSPLKPVSIARLELMAAHSLAKLARYVLEALKVQLTINETFLWSDSEIVLAWISKPSSNWKVFVRNRVQDIHDSFPSSVWGHCPGVENPADFHSRGMKLADLKVSELYWRGPPWLLKENSEWPSHGVALPAFAVDTKENFLKETAKVKLCTVATNSSSYENLFQGYNSYPKVVRLTARILRWRHPENKTLDDVCRPELIGPNEFENAEYYLFSLVQRFKFHGDFFKLQSSGRPSSTCRFLNMDPRFDVDRKLIVGGDRLKLSSLPEYTKSPIILPDKDVLVELLILHVHVRNHHCSQDTTIAILRERFHILHIRQEVRKVSKRCVVCKHHATKPLGQKMGILPTERVLPAFAFSDVGVDFAGPIYVKGYEDKVMRKAYVCLFTCTHSRMVHLELTNNMSTEEFLNALKRMINRRGKCRKIISDNQLTFKKADKVLQSSVCKSRAADIVQSYFSENNIVWEYITERSPHRGAFYERLVRSLKEPLRKVLGKSKLHYSELYTILTDIEATLNQRPLTYLGSDPRNLQAITPSHLAIGRALKTVPSVSSTAKLSRRFLHLQVLLKHFWKRWTKEYLPSLAIRTKWQTEEDVPKIGDVCLITEENTSRPTWPLGKIVEVIPGKDNLVRTFKLKTKSGTLTRPIQRLHLLERGDERTPATEISTLTAPNECSQGGEDVSTQTIAHREMAPASRGEIDGEEAAARPRRRRAPIWQKDYVVY